MEQQAGVACLLTGCDERLQLRLAMVLGRGMRVGAGVELDDRGADAVRGLDLPAGGGDENRDPDAGVGEGGDEVGEAVLAAIKESGAAGPKDMGKVMGLLKSRLAGRTDMGKLSGLVKAKLVG